jgi:hypothetical protein
MWVQRNGGKETMSPKKTILKTLSKEYQSSGPGTLTRPAAIPGFGEKPEKFQQAVNALLQERLIEGMKDPDGHMAIAINSQRMGDVKRELRPLWFRPAFLALMGLLAVAASMGFIN